MTPSIIQIAVVTLIAFIYGAEEERGTNSHEHVRHASMVRRHARRPRNRPPPSGAIVQLMSLGVGGMGGPSPTIPLPPSWRRR